MEQKERIIMGITIGDLNGIGSEVILKTFQDTRMLEFCTPVIFASVKLMSFYKKELKINVNFHGIDHLNKVVHKKINVLNVWKDSVNVQFGEEKPEAGAYAIKSLKAAVSALKKGMIDTLVTAPINKSTIQSKEFNFPGHTDYLAQELDGKSLMLMVSNSLRIGLFTDHVPVKEVSNKIDEALITEKITTIQKTLQQDFGIIKPKIAVLGINPHTGDNGVIGDEDDKVLRPAIEAIKNDGIYVFGPYAADSFFGSGNYKNFDAIIASYHDQGLIPFKTLSFGSGVNYTAGLSKIRTSPDHGTAYELAGKGEANEASFKEAVFAALRIYRTRNEYKAYAKSPLKVASKKPQTKKR